MDIETYALLKKKIESGEIRVDGDVEHLREEDIKFIREKAPGPTGFSEAALASMLDYYMAEENRS